MLLLLLLEVLAGLPELNGLGRSLAAVLYLLHLFTILVLQSDVIVLVGLVDDDGV